MILVLSNPASMSHLLSLKFSNVDIPTRVPPNLKFIVDDIEAPWPNDVLYDYIHGRSMSGSVSSWPKLFTEALNSLTPGGWLEMQSGSVAVRPGAPHWYEACGVATTRTAAPTARPDRRCHR